MLYVVLILQLFLCISVDFKKPSSPILTPQDLMKYLDYPKYCHEDIESSSALKHGVSICVYVLHTVVYICTMVPLHSSILWYDQWGGSLYFTNEDTEQCQGYKF